MASTTTTINVTTQKADAVLELQALISAIATILPKVDPFLLSRQTISRADLVAQAQKRLDAAFVTKSARLALHNAVEAERNAQANFKPLRTAFRSYLVSVYGANAPELQQFGYVQNRRTRKTVQSKANAATKSKATRAARGTKGKKQKAAIHGTPATASTGATAPAQVSQPTAPATAPASTSPSAPAPSGRTVGATAPSTPVTS